MSGPVIKLPHKFGRLYEPTRYKIYYGGRGGGKSWSIAQVLVALAYEKPLRILCTREFQNSIQDSVHRLISDQISTLKLDKWFKVTQTSITSSVGAQFIFKGLQRSIQEIKSTEGINICWVEEAQTISEDSWEILIPTIRAENSQIWISFNPFQKEDPTYQRFVINTPPDSVLEKVGWQDNRHFPAVLEQERLYMERIDPEAYQHVWEGFCRQVSDAVVYRGRFEVKGFDTPHDSRFYYGLDFGFSQDPCALVRCFIKDNILYIDQEAWQIGVELDDMEEFMNRVPGADKWPIKADNARPETISHLRRRNFNCSAAQKWAGSVEDGIAVMKGFEKIVIHERCKHAAEEFRLYSYKVDKQTNDILPQIDKKHDHIPDACRYALDGVVKHSNFFDDCSYADFPEQVRAAA
jgi:phage terminase large subunit